MSKLFKLKIILFTLGLFCFAANSYIFAQRRHPAEKSKAARSWTDDFKSKIDFANETGKTVRIYWLDQNGERQFLLELKDGQSNYVNTFVSYMYVVTDEDGNALGMYASDAQPRFVQLRNDFERPAPPAREREDEDDYANRNYNTTPVKICSNQEVPRGFLIINYGSDMNCPNWSVSGVNTYTIQRPSRTEPVKICGDQLLPRGFVITRAGSDMSCTGWSVGGTNTYTIRIPRDTEDVCSVSETPRWFVVISTGSDMNCPNWSVGATNTKRIKRVR